jgi:hypothetical protein
MQAKMPLPVLVSMKTSFPSVKALKLFTWLTVSAFKIKKNTERIKNIIELKCNIELEIRFKT